DMKRFLVLVAAWSLLAPMAQAQVTGPFEEKDFEWDPLLTHYKRIVIAGVNRAAREKPGCENLNPKSVRKWGGTPDDPEFVVDCQDGDPPLRAYFSKTDITGDPASDIPLEEKQAAAAKQ